MKILTLELVILTLVIVFQAGCGQPQPHNPESGPGPTPGSNHQESTAPDTEDRESGRESGQLSPEDMPYQPEMTDIPVDRFYHDLSLDALVQLGFDRDTLIIDNIQVAGDPGYYTFTATIGDESGPLALVISLENRKSVIGIRFLRQFDFSAPEPLIPGQDMEETASRLYGAMGLEARGYMRVTNTDMPPDIPYYEQRQDYLGHKVVTGEIFFAIVQETHSIEFIDIQELDLPEGFEINVSEAEAIQIARDTQGDESMVLDSSRLIVREGEGEEKGTSMILWELTFPQVRVYIRADNGDRL